MNKHSKMMVKLLVGTMITFALTGCGGGAKTETTSKSTSAWKPSGPITIINPYKAGGAGDLEVKAMQPILEKELGVRVITDYVTGGSGIPASEKVFSAKPDGRTILYLNNPAASIAEVTNATKYKVQDYTFLQNVSTEPRCLIALSKSGFKTFDDVLKKVKAGGQVSIAHSGIGSSGHLSILLLQEATKVKFNAVPFAGTGATTAAFLGGHVDLWSIDTVTASRYVKSGEAVVLGMFDEKRSDKFKEVPTFKELGYPVVVTTSRGFVAPPKTPENISKALIAAMNKAENSEAMKAYAKKSGSALNPVSGDDYKKEAMSVYAAVSKVKDLFKK